MAEPLRSRAVKFLTYRRVSNLYQRSCSLCKTLATKMSNAILGNDILDHMSCSHNPCAFSQDRLYLGDSLFSHRRYGYESLSAF